jgi:hypothetical protein
MNEVTDIVIYGGTSAGIMAAIQASRMKHSVVLIEPSLRLGGLSTGGLGSTDMGNNKSVGGLAREFYQQIKEYYDEPSNWQGQTLGEYEVAMHEYFNCPWHDENLMWRFEPSAGLATFNKMLQEAGVRVIFGEHLDRNSGVKMSDGGITSIAMKSGRIFRGRMFIDATYEGDLMAAAGVSYHVGRESNGTYNETCNGVQYERFKKGHQLNEGIDPYRIKGRPESGLLPGIDPKECGADGDGDHRIQSYCFRMCLTDRLENRLPFLKPENYQEIDFELLFRNYEIGGTDLPIPGLSDWGMSNILPLNSGLLPNRKTDSNNKSGFSTDFIGQNYRYPEADDEERVQIIRKHLDYQQGLMWTLSNHPRVPEHVRTEMSLWGVCKDEFIGSHGWPEQLYIREARRMVADYVLTEHNCLGHDAVNDSIGLASYAMDSHHVRRFVHQKGFVQNEGDVQVLKIAPYPIPYRSIVPRRAECGNLLVPVCLSASHIAYGSVRMEPTFMLLGQSAATAACLALDEQVPVQEVNYTQLKNRIVFDNQIVSWNEEMLEPGK